MVGSRGLLSGMRYLSSIAARYSSTHRLTVGTVGEVGEVTSAFRLRLYMFGGMFYSKFGSAKVCSRPGGPVASLKNY